MIDGNILTLHANISETSRKDHVNLPSICVGNFHRFLESDLFFKIIDRKILSVFTVSKGYDMLFNPKKKEEENFRSSPKVSSNAIKQQFNKKLLPS